MNQQLFRYRRQVRRRAVTQRQQASRRHFVLGCAGVLGLVFLLGVILLGGAGVFGLLFLQRTEQGLPDPASLGATVLPQTTRIYDRSGTHLLAMLYTEDRDYTLYAALPDNLVNATVATEDQTFWSNSGVDFPAILRAALNNASGGPQQGASTITEQLVKRLLVGDEGSYQRKLREALLAIKVGKSFSKKQVLEMYVNEIYYGQQAYGPAAAARRYFGKPLAELSLAQLAMLAGIPQGPTYNDPFLYPEQARLRQAKVLRAMYSQGYIKAPQLQEALEADLGLVAYHVPVPPVPWFSDRVIEEASLLLGGRDILSSCGCEIITTLDWDLQQIAQRDVTAFITSLAPRINARNAALVAEDPSTGEVLAYVGSINPASTDPKIMGAFDSAGLALRSPGSAWKGITYLAAMESGQLSAASQLWDVPTTFAPGYTPHDYSSANDGPVTVRQAIRESRNIPAIRAMLANGGTTAMLDMAQRLGITRDFPLKDAGPAMAIGTGSVPLTDMTAAYNTINNLGTRVEQHKILRILHAVDGTLLHQAQSHPRVVVDPKLAWSLLDILKDNGNPDVSWVTAGRADIGRPAAVKTGTEDELRDTYSMGLIPQLSVGVWVGNADNSSMAPDFHSYSGPLIIWHNFMIDTLKLKGWKSADWLQPAGMVSEKVCANRDKFGGYGVNRPPDEGCPYGSSSEWFIPGFNDPATIAARDGQNFGTFASDGRGRLVPDGCPGVTAHGVLAKAELPEWQGDLERWIARARLGQENHGRFHWQTFAWLLPASGDTCPALPTPKPRPTASPTPEATPSPSLAPSSVPSPALTPAPTPIPSA